MLLREPLTVNSLQLHNRIVMPPMATGKAVNGAPDEKLAAYYRIRARGTGLVIVEHAYILPEGMAHQNQLSLADDSVLGSFGQLTDAVHEEGTAIFAQLNHAGAKAKDTGLPAMGPSPDPSRSVIEMTHDDILRLIDGFRAAALRARDAGFDGVEIHSAHGYLLNQFYSPLTNHRTDAYTGQTLAGRIALHLQVLQAVREALGPNYPISIRLGACDYTEGGSTKDEIPEAVKAFQAAGADLISITGGLCGFVLPDHTEPGYFKELSRLALQSVTIPVLLTGGVTKPEEAEALLQEHAADLIGIGRAMLQDPQWSEKALNSYS